MGERKGQNKYYPPDYDPKKGGLNKFRGTHALRERARKIHLGIIIIRFEMPYNIWCEGCNNHIGMGVRYNAEKTKVGMYFSTPIYKFHMKCHLCDNYFDIQTDPGNLDYVILSGARRQENRWDPLQNEQVVPETKEVQKRLFDDPMYKLEHEAKDIKAGDDAKPVLEKLVERNKSVWDDCYEANSRLRAEFRNTKVELKAQSEVDNKLLAKSSLDIALLPETAEDKQMASLMQLHSKSAKERSSEKRLDILMQPTLPGATKTTFGGTKRQKILSTQLQFADLGIKKRQPSETIVVEEPTSSDETQPRPVCIEKKPVGSEQIDTITSTTSPPSAAPFIRLIVVSPSNPQHDKSSSVVLSVEAAEKLARMTAALKVPSSALARANRATHHAPVARAAARAPARAAVQAAPDAPVDLSLKATRSFAKVQAAPPVTEASVAAVPPASNISVAKVLTLPKSLALVCDYSSSNSDDDSD